MSFRLKNFLDGLPDSEREWCKEVLDPGTLPINDVLMNDVLEWRTRTQSDFLGFESASVGIDRFAGAEILTKYNFTSAKNWNIMFNLVLITMGQSTLEMIFGIIDGGRAHWSTDTELRRYMNKPVTTFLKKRGDRDWETLYSSS